MKREIISDALDCIDDGYISEAACYTFSPNNGKEKQTGTRKFIKIVLIAAVFMSLFAITALGVDSYVNSPQRAVEVAQQELKKMQELGLLSENIYIKDSPDVIREFDEQRAYEDKFGRILNHRYAVRSNTDEYTVCFNVDTKDGKVRYFNVQAFGDEYDEKVEGREIEFGDRIYYYYDNFDDLFDPRITIDQFCSRLAKYFGFSGYRLSSTVDEFYGYNTDVPDGHALLSTICDEAYLTIYFDGDQRGVPMYVQINHLPGGLIMNVGVTHAKG